MARTFTTSFSYNGGSYTAVITQLDGIVNMYIPDESLHNILPEGRASFNTWEGLRIDTPNLTPSQCLVLAIMTSLEMSQEVKCIHVQNPKP